MLVDDTEVHLQVRRRGIRPERVGRHLQTQFRADVARQRRTQRRVRRRHGGREGLREFGERPELVPQPLRHALGVGLHLLLQQTRHQPLAARRRHLVEQRHRHRHRHAVLRRARLEVVFELEAVRPHLQLVREILRGDAGRLVAHQVLAPQLQQAGLRALGFLAPFLEVGAVGDALRHPRFVEGVDQFVVHQDVRAARLVLQALDLLQQPLVVREEWRARLELALHQA